MRKLTHGLAALATLLVLLIGLPILLTRIAGWPLPGQVPDWGHVRQMVQQGDIPADPVVKSLALILWVLWLAIVWSLVWELITTPRHTVKRPEPAPLVPAPISAGVGRLVAAIFAIGLVTAHSTASLAAGLPRIAAIESVATPTATAASRHIASGLRTRQLADTRAWVAESTDTLWDIATTALGDGTRVEEIIDLNPGIGTGRTPLAGRTIQLPNDANIPASRRPATPSTSGDGERLTSKRLAASTPGELLDESMPAVIVSTAEAPTGAEAPAPRIAASALVGVHVVVHGDTLWQILHDHYGQVDADVVWAVADYNHLPNPGQIGVGQRILLPPLDPSGTIIPAAVIDTAASPPVQQPGATNAYVVVKGDSLWTIIERHYGHVHADLVAHIAAVNGIAHPNLIYPGQLLVLPDDPISPAPTPEPTRTTPPIANQPNTPTVAPDPTPAPPAAVPTSTPDETHSAAEPANPTGAPTAPTPAVVPALPVPATASADPGPTVAPPAPRPLRTGHVEPSGFDLSVRTVWWGTAAGTLLSGGILLMLRRLRGRRMQTLEPGHQLPVPPSLAAGTELAVRACRPGERIDTLRTLLTTITPHARELREPPAVRAVELDTDRIEVLFNEPAPYPPTGWTTANGGRSWVHRTDNDQPSSAVRQIVAPALVTVGHRPGGGEVLLDLETAGTVSLAGDHHAAMGLARSMVLELATYPLGVPIDVGLVGVELDGVEHCDRTWANTTMTRAVRVARQTLERTTESGVPSLVAARASSDDDDGSLDPHVFVVNRDALTDADVPLLADLIQLCQSQAGAATIIIGNPPGVHETIQVTGDGTATWSGTTLQTPQISREAAAQVAVMFDHAANAPDEPLERSALVDALLQHHTSVGVDDESDTHDADGEVEEVYVEPAHDVLVRLMGEVRVEGAPITAPLDVELLALLVCLRDRQPNIDTVQTLLGTKELRTIQNRVGSLRTKLGTDADGNDLIPAAKKGPRSGCVYLVSERVLTDVDLLEHRYQTALQLPSGDAISVLRDGLPLLAGPAFRARHGYDWAWPEGVQARLCNIVNAYAARLMELAFDRGDIQLVLETVRHAGTVMTDPIVEAPMRRLEREYANATGDPALLASVAEAHRRLVAYASEHDTLTDDV